MHRPAFVPVPPVVLNTFFSQERAKVSTRDVSHYGLFHLVIILNDFQIMLEGQKVVPKRVKELGFHYQYPDIQSACAEIVGKRIAKHN